MIKRGKYQEFTIFQGNHCWGVWASGGWFSTEGRDFTRQLVMRLKTLPNATLLPENVIPALNETFFPV